MRSTAAVFAHKCTNAHRSKATITLSLLQWTAHMAAHHTACVRWEHAPSAWGGAWRAPSSYSQRATLRMMQATSMQRGLCFRKPTKCTHGSVCHQGADTVGMQLGTTFWEGIRVAAPFVQHHPSVYVRMPHAARATQKASQALSACLQLAVSCLVCAMRKGHDSSFCAAASSVGGSVQHVGMIGKSDVAM